MKCCANIYFNQQCLIRKYCCVYWRNFIIILQLKPSYQSSLRTVLVTGAIFTSYGITDSPIQLRHQFYSNTSHTQCMMKVCW